MAIKKQHAIILLIFSVILFLSVSLTGEHPFIKLFLTSPKEGKVLLSNIGIEDAVDFGYDFYEKGETVKAIIAFDYALKQDPQNIDAYMGIARTYSDIKNYEEAKKYINKAIENINQDTLADMAYMAYKNGGAIYQNSTYYEGITSNAKALEYYKAALEISDKVENPAINKLNSNVYYCMARILFTEAQYEAAAENFIRSLELDPNDPILNFNIAVCYIELKDFGKAYDYLIKTKNAGFELETSIGFILYYTEKGEMKKALEYIKDTETKYKDKPMFNYYLANYYEKEGNISKAKELYKDLLEASPNSIFAVENQKIIERLNIDVTGIKEKLQKEKEEKYHYKVVKNDDV